jgi:ABC-2 type transport system ATP-binding protein
MSGPAVQLTDVGKDYPMFSLRDISLEILQGEIAGFIGPNGAGKSTTIRIIMGLIYQDRGEVHVLGHEMPADQVAAKWHIGFASDDMRLYGSCTLDWHMRFLRSIFPDWDQPYAEALLKRFGLRAAHRVKGLSHGQRVKAALLLVLARRPRLLVLDEPTTGLDPVVRHEVLRELTDVLRDDGRSVLFSSHNTHDIEQVADRITFIDGGRIIDSRDKETFLDRWRRIRVELPGDVALPVLPGVIDVRQAGRLAVATTNAFDAALPRAYEAAGIRVQAVEPMTLEEIFVSNVQYSRGGGDA